MTPFYTTCRLNTNLFPDYVKLIGYFASAVNVVPSNLCVGPSPRIRIFLLLLSIGTHELILATKIMTFFPKFLFVNKNSERESNPMP